MASGSKLWGAQWLGDAVLWGDYSHEMNARWVGAGLTKEDRAGAWQYLSNLEHIGIGVLEKLLSAKRLPSGSSLICGFQFIGSVGEQYVQTQAHSETACQRFDGLAAGRFGVYEKLFCGNHCVVGGLEMTALAQDRLDAGISSVVCLAAAEYAPSRKNEFNLRGKAAAVLGLGSAGQEAIGGLGMVASGQYEGIPDSGAQTDFLERLGLEAKGDGLNTLSAIVMNQPPDYIWQAALDAAARRVAPRARRYTLPVDAASQAGGLMLIMAGLSIDTPRPESPRLVLAVDEKGRAASLMVSPL
jgi:hypothetical protein